MRIIAKEIEPNIIEQEIISRLNSLVNNPDSDSMNWETSEWTRKVKSEVANLGKSFNYYVYAHTCEPTDGGEWLFDLCWMDYQDDKFLSNLPLVMECEWGDKGSEDDFQKLVVARAEHRIMIFTIPTKADRDEYFLKLLNHATTFKFSRQNDRYLMMCWKNEDRGFDSRVFEMRS